MKSHGFRFRVLPSLAIIASSLPLHAATRYWDGADTGANAQGGAGTWTTTSPTNWDTLAFGGADAGWATGDIAVFGGTASTSVSIGTGGVTVGGLTFNTTAYTIGAGTNGLNFATGTNNINMVMSTGTTAATITGTVGGTGAVNLSSHPLSNSTLTFSGASSTGWSGATTINSNVTLTTTSASGSINQVLNSTSGITLNGGAIQFNRATNANINAISDSAAITVNGGGTFGVTGGDAGGTSAIETIGAVTLNSGQMNFNWTNSPSGAGNLIVLSGFTRSGSSSAVTFSFGANGTFRNNAVSTNTAANEIIGAWATTGAAAGTAAQTDYAVYSGGNGTITARGIAASAQSTWSTTHAATSNYTLNTTNVTANVNGRLTANRNINTLRNLTGATAPSVVDATTDYITMAGNDLQNGDVVVSRNTTGGQLTQGQAYYVINKDGAGAGTFQVSATPGGTKVDLTTTATGFISGGVSLNGNILGTYGILNGSSDPMAIGRAGGGSITLPVANVNDNLYVTNGNASIWIDAPITDNGTGKLTLVKGGTSGNGSGDVSLSGTNTYTGGTVVNSGTLTFRSAGSWVNNQNFTFGGSGTLIASVGNLAGGTLDVKQGAVGVINGSSAITFTTTTGAGTIVRNGGGTNVGNLNLGDASGFTGTLQISQASGTNPRPNVLFSNLGDGGALQFGGGQGDSNQKVTFQLNGTNQVTWGTRQVQILPRSGSNNAAKSLVLDNNSGNDANDYSLVINTNLLNSSDRSGQGFVLGGSNTDNNAFNGVIGNSTVNGAALNVNKNGAGKWILGGNNTFTGRLVVGQGTLSVATFNDSTVAGPLGMGTAIQLGGDERANVGGSATELILTGSNSGTLEYTGGAVTSTRSFLIGDTLAANTGGGRIDNNSTTGAMTFTAANFNTAIAGITATRTLTLGGTYSGAANEIQGVIQDNVLNTGKINVAKANDASTWTLAGNNSYTGTTTVFGGTLAMSGTNTGTGLITVSGSSGATLTISGNNSGMSGGISLSTATGTSASSPRLNINSATALGSGTLLFGGGAASDVVRIDNTSASAVTVSTANAITLNRNFTFVGTRSLNLGTGTATIGGLTTGTNRLITVTANTLTFGGTIAEGVANVGITKQGNGTMVIDTSAAGTYTGATTVTAGVLAVNGSLANTTTTVNGGTLQGSGSIGGSVTVNNTGTLAPGNSIESLATGALTFNNGSTFEYEFNSTAITGDLVVANGNLDINSVATLSLTDLNAGPALAVGTKLTLINYSGSWTSGDIFNGFADDSSFLLGLNTWEIDYNDTSGGSNFSGEQAFANFVTLTVVPEPRAALLGAIGILLLFRRRR